MPVWRNDLISSRGGPGGHRRNLRQAGPAPGGEAGKAPARRVKGPSDFELSERLRQPGERFRWLRENGEAPELLPGQPWHPWPGTARGDYARTTAPGGGIIASCAVARYLEERKQG